MEIIKDRAIVEDTWVWLRQDDTVSDGADLIVPMERFRLEADGLLRRPAKTGVCVTGDTDAETLEPWLDKLVLIVVEFPKFTDGRGYSLARLLRDRYGFAGELRAVGNVLRDQLLYMTRCGFDSFCLSDGKDLQEALGAFDEFSEFYQPASDVAQPLWKRKPRGE